MSMSYAEFLKYTLQRGPTWKGGVSFQKWFRASMLWRRSAIAAWLINSSSFAANLTHSLVPEKGTGTTATFTRAADATFTDFEGVLRTAPAGCARFVGARFVRNLVTVSSEDFSAGWNPGANGTGSAPTITGGYAAGPTDGSMASRVQFNVGAGTADTDSSYIYQLPACNKGLAYFWVKSNTGANQRITIRARASSTIDDYDATVTTEWQLIKAIQTGGTAIIELVLLGDWKSANTADILVSKAQLEDITGRADQTTPSEYVSVGATPINLILQSQTLGTTWAASGFTVTADQIAAPDGTTTADLLTSSAGAGAKYLYQTGATLIPSATTMTLSAYIYVGTASYVALTAAGAANEYVTQVFNLATGALGESAVGSTSGTLVGSTITADSRPGWYRATLTYNITTVSANRYIVFHEAKAATGNTFDTLGIVSDALGSRTSYAWGFQVQTGSSATTYIPTTTVAKAYNEYHGAGVDGVKYFDTDLSGNPLPTEYTYDAVSLNGVAGTYVSTPDSVAASITGDIDIRWYGVLPDYTPSAAMGLVDKLAAAGNRSYLLRLNPAGDFMLYWSEDGTALKALSSSVANGVTDNTATWFRATLDVDNGAGGYTARFYKSTDGVTWTQLGTDQTGAGTTSIYNSTQQIALGFDVNAATYLSGKIYRVQIYNGINGTLAVDFDASRYAGGTTLTGSTGETWTLQGNAVIHPTNSPNTGYIAEGARTNLGLYSNDYATWSSIGAIAATQNAVGPDGATSGWTLTDSDAANILYKQITTTLTAATHTESVFVKKTTGATVFPCVFAIEGTRIAICTVDTNNGVATVWTAYTGLTVQTSSARCTSYNSLYWRVELTFLATAAVWQRCLAPAGTANATQSTGVLDVTRTGSAVFFGSQIELGSFASSYIPTTTAAVTRNADVLTYPSAGNIDKTTGWISAEAISNDTTGGASLYGTWVYNDGAGNAGIFLGYASSVINFGSGGNAVFNTNASSSNSVTAGNALRTAATWGSASKRVALNGTVGSSQTFTPALTGSTNLYIGQNSGAGSQIYGTIRNVRIGQRALSSSELQAITA